MLDSRISDEHDHSCAWNMSGTCRWLVRMALVISTWQEPVGVCRKTRTMSAASPLPACSNTLPMQCLTWVNDLHLMEQLAVVQHAQQWQSLQMLHGGMVQRALAVHSSARAKLAHQVAVAMLWCNKSQGVALTIPCAATQCTFDASLS